MRQLRVTCTCFLFLTLCLMAGRHFGGGRRRRTRNDVLVRRHRLLQKLGGEDPSQRSRFCTTLFFPVQTPSVPSEICSCMIRYYSPNGAIGDTSAAVPAPAEIISDLSDPRLHDSLYSGTDAAMIAARLFVFNKGQFQNRFSCLGGTFNVCTCNCASLHTIADHKHPTKPYAHGRMFLHFWAPSFGFAKLCCCLIQQPTTRFLTNVLGRHLL